MARKLDKTDAVKSSLPARASVRLWGSFTQRLSSFLARTKFGQKVLAEEVDLSTLRRRPSFSLYLGLVLMALSYIIGGPAIVLSGYKSVVGEGSWIMAAAAVAVFVLVHIVFAVGAWLAGANYASLLLRWVLRRFLLGHADHISGPA